MSDTGSWTTIESDPGVFTELIQKIGVQGIQVEELFMMDEEQLQQMEPIYGLIFLFKWSNDHAESDKRVPVAVPPEGLFFANQVITNACATQAILSILLNIPHESKVRLGDTLENFRNFTVGLDSETAGLAIGQSEVIRTAHNSFARPEPFVMEERAASKEEDEVFHFIAYIPFGDGLWELDGLKQGPIRLGSLAQDGRPWYAQMLPHIQERIAKYASNEIKFNLMAVIHDRTEVLSERVQQLKAQLQQAQSESVARDLDRQLRELRMQRDEEKHKHEKWRIENVRRRHNYVPFLVNMLKMLAQNGELESLVEQGKQKYQREQEAKKSQSQK